MGGGTHSASQNMFSYKEEVDPPAVCLVGLEDSNGSKLSKNNKYQVEKDEEKARICERGTHTLRLLSSFSHISLWSQLA